jgi:hypothetical protein
MHVLKYPLNSPYITLLWLSMAPKSKLLKTFEDIVTCYATEEAVEIINSFYLQLH